MVPHATQATSHWNAARNVGCLCLAYAMALSNGTVVANVTPTIAVEMLNVPVNIAPTTVGALLLGASLSSGPGALLMQAPQWGRRRVFLATTAVVMGGTALGLLAVYVRSFAALIGSCFLIGFGQGIGQFYRFAVVEICDPWPESIAVSLVITGGCAAALAGPWGSTITRFALPVEFAGSYFFVAVLNLVNLLALLPVHFPSVVQPSLLRSRVTPELPSRGTPTPRKQPAPASVASVPVDPRSTIGEAARVPLWRLVTQPDIGLAVAVTTLAHTTMLMLMGPVTLAIEAAGFSFEQASGVLTWHFLAMFAPSVVVGSLIDAVGPLFVSFGGGVLYMASAGVMLSGSGDDEDDGAAAGSSSSSGPPALSRFWIGMFLCGLAWNLLFSSGTIILTRLYRPEDAIRVQGANDILIFGIAGLGSCVSGVLYEQVGGASIATAVRRWRLPLPFVLVARPSFIADVVAASRGSS